MGSFQEKILILLLVPAIQRIRLQYWSFVFLFFMCQGSSEKQNITINLMVPKVHMIFSYDHIYPGIEVARKLVESEQYLPNHNLMFNYSDTECSATLAPVRAFQFMNKGGHAILGPVCDYSLAPVGRYAPFWQMPVITAGGMARDFKNKTEYQTLTIMGPNFHSMTEFILRALREYKWSKIQLLYDPYGQRDLYDQFCFIAGSAIIKGIKDRKRTFSGDFTMVRDEEKLKYGDILKEKIGQKYAVVVLCASADSVREIMIKAHELNFDNGEYVFLNIDLFSSKNESEKPWLREDDTDERNMKAKKAYEALMTVTLRKPISDDYQRFSEEVKRRAKENDKNFTYGEEEVNSFVGAFHDAVILYALALNESLSQNMSITNGTEITRRMWNRTFTGITGTVSIDDNGDRNADYSLLDMEPGSGRFKVVANYFGNNKEYKPVAKIHWAGGRTSPPPDTPKCGFDGSKCPPSEPFPEYGIVIIVLGSLLVIFLIAAFFIYRHIKLEAELAEMNWRVKWEDIMFGSMENEKKLRRQGSTVSLQRTNGDACAEGRVLIERGDTVDQTWCKCGSCEDSDRRRRLCCRQLELFGIFQEEGTCITGSQNFKEVVINKDVLTSVFIHVMLIRRQRGAAPMDLSPCKFRLMATRQFLCWMHRGQKLKKESRMTVPSCVSRTIRMAFPDEDGPDHTYSRGSCTTTSFAEIMPLDT